MGVMKRLGRALKERRGELAWTITSSLIGGVIGLLMAAAYVRSQGW